MPKHSSCDRSAISQMIHDFEAFPRVHSPSSRRELESRSLHWERILTLKSFQADTILLQACYEPLRDIFPTEGTTLRRTCKDFFQLDLQYFEANYIELWLQTMRSLAYDELKKNRKKDKHPSRLRTGANVELASFAAARGFWSNGIKVLLKQSSREISSQHMNLELRKFSRDQVDIPTSSRCSRPRRCDHEKGWKDLSLENVYQEQAASTNQYPTAFAVARHMIWSFWGCHPPYGWDHSERIVQRSEYLQYINAPVCADSGARTLRDYDTSANDVNVEEVAQGREISPPSASSIYRSSGESPSPPTSPQHAVGSSVNRGSCQAHEVNINEFMPLSSDTRSNWPASAERETPTLLSPPVESHSRKERMSVDKAHDRVERVDQTLHDMKKEGRGNPHRIEKPQHYKGKKELRQQQKRLTRVLQGHDYQCKMTSVQREFNNLVDRSKRKCTTYPTLCSMGRCR